MEPTAVPRTKITHEGSDYDVTTVPAPNSKIVIDNKSTVLGTVKLDKLVHNLAITGDLIYLAYSATPPKYGELRAQIDQLHLGFGDIAGECVTELGNIKSASQEVSRKLGAAFGMLFQGREDIALTMLSRCADDAAKLADAAGRLATRFDDLCKIADKALADSQKKLGDEIDARDKLTDAKNDLIATQGRLAELQTKLAKLVGDLKLEYDEAKGKLSKTEDRAFALAITGAIMQPLGQALGGAASAVALVYSSRAVPPSLPGTGTALSGGAAQPASAPETQTRPPSAEEQKKFDDAKAKLQEAELDAKAAEEDKKTLEATMAVTKKRLDTLPDREKDPAERRKEEAALQGKVGEIQRNLDTTASEKDRAKAEVERRQKEFDAVKLGIEKLGVAISTAGEKLSSMGNDYIKIAESQREHVKELFKVWIEKQDAEREILGQVKEAALRLENIGKQELSAKVTISALFQVVAAMKQVVAILHDARAFWQNMANACKDLANPQFRKDIKENAALYPTDDRVTLFYDNDGFKLPLLNYLGKWRALEIVATEYIEATKDVRTKVMDNFKVLLVGDKAKAKVKELSLALLGEVANDIAKLDAETVTVEQALATVEKLPKAA